VIHPEFHNNNVARIPAIHIENKPGRNFTIEGIFLYCNKKAGVFVIEENAIRINATYMKEGKVKMPKSKLSIRTVLFFKKKAYGEF